VAETPRRNIFNIASNHDILLNSEIPDERVFVEIDQIITGQTEKRIFRINHNAIDSTISDCQPGNVPKAGREKNRLKLGARKKRPRA
jgi:hypothetical protein